MTGSAGSAASRRTRTRVTVSCWKPGGGAALHADDGQRLDSWRRGAPTPRVTVSCWTPGGAAPLHPGDGEALEDGVELLGRTRDGVRSVVRGLGGQLGLRGDAGEHQHAVGADGLR